MFVDKYDKYVLIACHGGACNTDGSSNEIKL